MKLRKVFAKIFEGLNHAGTVLNFIKYKQGFPGKDFFTKDDASQFFKNTVYVKVIVKVKVIV